jgi:predicted MFS family arabinose efflux permease
MYACILVLFILQRDKLSTQVQIQAADAPAEHSMAFMKLPVVWWCFAYFLLSIATLSVVQNFSIPILKAMQGVSFETATLTLTAYMLCSALGMLAGGFVAARIANSDRVVAVAMAVAALLLALCGTGILGALATMVVLAGTGFAVGVGGPSRDMMIRRATPKGATGRVFGLVYSGMDVGSSISPILFGAFMDRGWYGATLIGAAVVLAFSVVAALGVGRLTSAGTVRA